MTSYAVSRRQSEIGIRLALGAAPGGVVRLVLARVALLVGAGVIAGVLVSLWTARFVEALLFGLTPHDPMTLVAAALILAVVGALAGWIPARRASRIDPAQVLRDGSDEAIAPAARTRTSSPGPCRRCTSLSSTA